MALLYSFLLFQNKYKITLYCRKPLPKCEHMFYNEFEVVNMIPNPNAPDEYKYETDYRKIPRQYLDANIPRTWHGEVGLCNNARTISTIE